MLRSELVRSIKRFSLNYEQNQLLRAGVFEALVSYLAYKKKTLTVLLALAAAYCGVEAIRGILGSKMYLPWLMTGSLLASWTLMRLSKVRAMVRAFQNYLDAVGCDAINSPSCSDELKLYVSLSYEEHQAAKADELFQLIGSLIQRRRANSFQFAIGAMISGAISIIQGWAGVGFAIFLLFAATVAIVRDCSVIERIKKIARRHSEEIEERLAVDKLPCEGNQPERRR
ncbi:MAG: hypothetical protein AAFV88_01725 [Planctomycetota bacterium]